MQTALHIAVRKGHLDIVKLLVEKGSDVNAKDIAGRTPLWYAIKSENLEVVRVNRRRNSKN